MSDSLSVGTALLTVPQAAPTYRPTSAVNGLLDKKQAGKYLNVCVGTVDNIVRDGDLRPVRVRGRVMFDPADLARYVERQKEGKP